jgi:hypothetical protein
MASQLTRTGPPSQQSLPAWTFSLLFHLSAIALLAMVLKPWPRGASGAPDGSIGIVLSHSSADGELLTGEVGPQNKDEGDDKNLEPPPLIAAAVEPATVGAAGRDQARTLPVRLAAAPAAPSEAQNSNDRPAARGAGRSGSPSENSYARVSVFGVEGKGSKFVYLFDRSASMEGAPLAAAKRQLLDSLRSLNSVHQFQIIFFNSKTRIFDATAGGGRVAFASDRNKQLAANFVGGITADGGTDRMVGLREAIAFSPDVVFFLSDADDPMSKDELAEIAKLNRRAQAAICVIEFGRQPAATPDNFLMQLARESGGQYGYVNTETLMQPLPGTGGDRERR